MFKRKSYLLLGIIELIVSLLFMFVLYRLNIMPGLVLLAIGLSLLIVNLLVLRFRLRVVAAVLSVLLLIGSYFLYQGYRALGNVSGAGNEVNRYVVYVLADSNYQSVEGLSLEYSLMFKDEGLEEAATSLRTVKPQDEYVSLMADLVAGKTDGILVNEKYNFIFEEEYRDFNALVKELWVYEVESKTDVIEVPHEFDVTKDGFTVFVSGIDTYGSVSTVSRSDVNMLVSVNPVDREILLTSIPRDYYITLANMGKEDKLTHAGLAGVGNSVKSLEDFLGIDIRYYARVNFTSLIKIVDALDGITVYSPVSFTTLHGNYYIQEGDNFLNGDKALGFVRERYSLANGDNDRIKNQQRVLSAMIKKVCSPAVIKNFSKVLDSLAGSFETSLSAEDISSLIKMQLNNGGEWKVSSIQLSGTGTNMTGGAYMPNSHLYYMIPDMESVNNAVAQIKELTGN